jgi:hypothetical protein
MTPRSARAHPGPARRRPRRTPVAVMGLSVLLLGAARACGTQANNDKYGSLPRYLPKSTLHPDSVLTGTTKRAAVASEGDSVEVRLPHGSVLTTVTGPEVPGEGLSFQTPATTCTWTVTLTHARGLVPIALGAFSTLDEVGKIYHPAWVPGQPRPPATVAPGRTVTFELRVVMRTGEGLMRWAPVGPRIVSEWDFVVEND